MVRSEKAEALNAIHVPNEAAALQDSVRAQYVAARVGDYEVEDYRGTADVRPDSTTETYVALKLIAISGVGMTFKYQDYFDATPSTGYETLIYDCRIGDAILFQRANVVLRWLRHIPCREAAPQSGYQSMTQAPS